MNRVTVVVCLLPLLVGRPLYAAQASAAPNPMNVLFNHAAGLTENADAKTEQGLKKRVAMYGSAAQAVGAIATILAPEPEIAVRRDTRSRPLHTPTSSRAVTTIRLDDLQAMAAAIWRTP